MKRLVIGAGIAILAAGCGKSEQQKQAEQVAAGAQQAAAGAQQAAAGAQQAAQAGGAQAAAGAQQAGQAMAQGLQQMAQGLGQMAQGSAKAVPFEDLKALVPDMAGWERSNFKGSSQNMGGISVSTAEARYKSGEQNVKLEITDTALSQFILMPFTMMSKAGYEERSDDGYKKAIAIGGNPGFEEWDKNDKHGEVQLLVGSRYLIHADGHDVASTDVVRKFVESVDAAKLAALK